MNNLNRNIVNKALEFLITFLVYGITFT